MPSKKPNPYIDFPWFSGEEIAKLEMAIFLVGRHLSAGRKKCGLMFRASGEEHYKKNADYYENAIGGNKYLLDLVRRKSRSKQ